MYLYVNAQFNMFFIMNIKKNLKKSENYYIIIYTTVYTRLFVTYRYVYYCHVILYIWYDHAAVQHTIYFETTNDKNMRCKYTNDGEPNSPLECG